MLLVLCVYFCLSSTIFGIYVPSGNLSEKPLATLGIKTIGWQDSGGGSLVILQNYSGVKLQQHTDAKNLEQVYEENRNRDYGQQVMDFDQFEEQSQDVGQKKHVGQELQNVDQVDDNEFAATAPIGQHFTKTTVTHSNQNKFYHPPEKYTSYDSPTNRQPKVLNPQNFYSGNRPLTTNQLDQTIYSSCPPGATGQFIYDQSCKQFLNCYKGRGHAQNCAPGTLFNPKTLECDFVEKVECVTSVNNLKLDLGPISEKIQASCPKGFSGIIPHYTDCSKFINCANGVEHMMDCAPGTLFNVRSNNCDFPHKAECVGAESGKNYFGGASNTHQGSQDYQWNTQNQNAGQNKWNTENQNAEQNQWNSQNHRGNYQSSSGSNFDQNHRQGHKYDQTGSYSNQWHQGINANTNQGHKYTQDQKGSFSQGQTTQHQGQSGLGWNQSQGQSGSGWNQSQGQSGSRQSGSGQSGSGQSGLGQSGSGQSGSGQSGSGQSGSGQSGSVQSGSGQSWNQQGQTSWNQYHGQSAFNTQTSSNQFQGPHGFGQNTTQQHSQKIIQSGRPKCPAGFTGITEHPFDCKKFLNCANGATFIQDCGPGTVFNPSIKGCDHPKPHLCRQNAHGNQNSLQQGNEKVYQSENQQYNQGSNWNQNKGTSDWNADNQNKGSSSSWNAHNQNQGSSSNWNPYNQSQGPSANLNPSPQGVSTNWNPSSQGASANWNQHQGTGSWDQTASHSQDAKGTGNKNYGWNQHRQNRTYTSTSFDQEKQPSSWNGQNQGQSWSNQQPTTVRTWTGHQYTPTSQQGQTQPTTVPTWNGQHYTPTSQQGQTQPTTWVDQSQYIPPTGNQGGTWSSNQQGQASGVNNQQGQPSGVNNQQGQPSGINNQQGQPSGIKKQHGQTYGIKGSTLTTTQQGQGSTWNQGQGSSWNKQNPNNQKTWIGKTNYDQTQQTHLSSRNDNEGNIENLTSRPPNWVLNRPTKPPVIEGTIEQQSVSKGKSWPPPFPSTDLNADYVFEEDDLDVMLESDLFPLNTQYTSYNSKKDWCDAKGFECGDKVCVAPSSVCDGKKDCPNGKDENDCEDAITQFSPTRQTKLAVREVEKTMNITLKWCAKKCFEEKRLNCKSFNYRKHDGTCFLLDTNVGKTGALIILPNYDYYENKAYQVSCDSGYSCRNKKCISKTQICDGVNDCTDWADEKGCTAENFGYMIKLAGSDQKNSGRIEIDAFGKTGYICDDMFGLRNADVACRELGFPLGALEVRGNSVFAADLVENDTFYMMDDVSCLGNETTLRDCDFGGWGVHNCRPQEIVGVICKTPLETCPEDHWKCETGNECLQTAFVCDGVYDCTDKSDEEEDNCDSPIEVRLANGTSKMNGRVEIRYHGIWGTVCDDDFNDEAAKVVCGQLGFRGSGIVKKGGYYGPGIGPIWLDQVFCQGNESKLASCIHWDWGEHNCDHNEDVGVVCNHQEIINEHPRNIHHPQEEDEHLPEKCGFRNDAIFLDEESDVHFRVVQGSAAKAGEYPWQASIRVKGKTKATHWCGAVVISKRHVLTAAHCLSGYIKDAYTVFAGDYNVDVNEGTEQEAYIEDFQIHDYFRSGSKMNNDIALIKLKSPGFKFTDAVQPICLPEATFEAARNANCTISGFGSVESGKARASRNLRAGWIPLQSREICKMPHVYGEAITEGMICAGSLDEGVDACDGDSGGPLACLNDGVFTLFGITSWGQHCGYANKPGVYVNVAHYRHWIERTMKKM